MNDEVEFTEGLTIDRGYVSPYFVNDQERQLCELMDPKILVTDNKIENVNDLIPLLEVLYSLFFWAALMASSRASRRWRR